MLKDVISSTETTFRELQLLTGDEREQLLVEWNDTAALKETSLCVHQLFEQHARTAPNAIAVFSGDQTLTYGELNAQADVLAYQLRRRGVGPESIVAISTDRSLEMFVGVLGVLKAGGAYLPLDPHYPSERLNLMFGKRRSQ